MIYIHIYILSYFIKYSFVFLSIISSSTNSSLLPFIHIFIVCRCVFPDGNCNCQNSWCNREPSRTLSTSIRNRYGGCLSERFAQQFGTSVNRYVLFPLDILPEVFLQYEQLHYFQQIQITELWYTYIYTLIKKHIRADRRICYL